MFQTVPCPRSSKLLDTALAVGCSSLQTYTSALQAPYPLAKLDLVGLPNFAAGAMENWGCITFRWVPEWSGKVVFLIAFNNLYFVEEQVSQLRL